jgi:hypothetical protein
MHRGIEHGKTNIKRNSRPKKICTALGRNRIAQATEPRGDERMTTETQGISQKRIIKEPEGTMKITKAKDGLKRMLSLSIAVLWVLVFL